MERTGRNRTRSGSVKSENPLLNPITPEEEELARLRNDIIRLEEAEKRARSKARLFESGGYSGNQVVSSQKGEVDQGVEKFLIEQRAEVEKTEAKEKAPRSSRSSSSSRGRSRALPSSSRPETPSEAASLPSISQLNANFSKMNFEYINSQGSSASGSQPRSAPPSPSQSMAHTNGMNGGMAIGNGMVGYPTPAGHQSDLNYIMSMVEELSGVLNANRALTDSVTEKMGLVRERAKDMNLTNDEMIAIVADELNADSKNLEKENSELRKALEKSEYNRKENFKLACHGANILADITEKVHRFKEQTESDCLAWHKNYRKQLEIEREENMHLRNHIEDMKAAARRANEGLRGIRRYLTDDKHLTELTIQNVALRQEKRFWKRMALPLIPDDDSEWSDDDDLIDPEEKKRQHAAILEKGRKADETEGGEGSNA